VSAVGVARFFASGWGRGLRIFAGVVLAVLGVASGGWWLVLTALGVVFVAVGAVNICLLAPLFGGPLRGNDLARPQER
jgi:hypothetical protein